ncbi:MAG: PEGA domain-containing protein, partial [Chitinivibrionales bacterium]
PAGLAVISEPSGAILSLNCKSVGETPFETNKLRPGNYEVQLEHAGYQQYSENVSLTEGKVDTLQVDMKPVQNKRTPADEKTGEATEEGEEDIDANSLLNKIAIGLFLAFSVVILVIELAGDE